MKNAKLRELQLFDLNMLDEVDRICKKYNLRYWLSSGTLLGAVRHKGFIPWDDDVDIDMPVEDYKKFCKVVQKELGDRYFWQTYKTDKENNVMWGRIRANHTTSMIRDLSEWNIHWGICIDVFPIIGLYDNPRLRRIQNVLFGLNRTLLSTDYEKINKNRNYEFAKKVKFLMRLPRWFRHRLCDLNNLFLFKSFYSSTYGSNVWSTLKANRKVEYCKKLIDLEFEGKKYKVPENYDGVLTDMYGDYMTPPPVEQQGGHELNLGKIVFDLNKDYREYKKGL